MIWPRDAAVLAYTKLKTRRVRHAVVIITSSLLFITIASVLFVVRGTVGSVESYMKTGFASRYILSATQLYEDLSNNKEIIARAKEIQKELIKQKNAESKRLGLNYDQISEQQVSNSYTYGNVTYETLTDQNYGPITQAIKEYFDKNKNDDKTKLLEMGSNYGIKNDIFLQKAVRGSAEAHYLKILEDGKETFENTNQNNNQSFNVLSNFANEYSLFSEEVLKPFLLKDQNLEKGSDGSIPVLVPYSAAIKLLNSKELDASANTKQKAEYLNDIRTKIAGFNFEVCYRNKTSKFLLDTAISEINTFNTNKDKKDYVKPDLIRDVPKKKCGPVTVFRDTRSADQKSYDAKQLAFDEKFGQEPAEQRLLKYRVVGILSSPDNGSFSLQTILEGVLSSSVGSGWVTPLEITEKDALFKKLSDARSIYDNSQKFFIEFADADQARKFLREKNCTPDYNFVDSSGNYDAYSKCKTEGKIYNLSTFGGNSIAISEFKSTFYKYFNYSILYMGAFAALTLFGVISRVIADSRREVAVFRAIGAKKLDIAQIYVTYALMIGTIILIISIFSGLMIGQFLQNRYANDFSISTSIVFNSNTINDNFKIYTVAPIDVLRVTVAVYVTCVVSAILPIVINSRRNPISDMRDER